MKRKLFLKKLLKFVVTIILLVVLFHKINIKDLKSVVGIVNRKKLYVSILMYLISVELNAIKWKILLPGIGVRQLSKTCFKAQFYSMVLPGQLFGEASKVLDLKGSGESPGRVTSSVIIDKITSLIGTMLVGILGVIFTEIKMPNTIRILFVIMLFVLLILMMSSRLKLVNNIVRYGSYCLWKCSKITIRKFSANIYRLYATWRSYSSEGIALFKSVIVGIINQMLGVFQVWMIADSIGINVSIIEFCWIMPTVSVILLLPISFGGLGVREISLTGFLSLFGVASEKAVTISFISLLSQIVSAIIGAIAVGYDGIKKNIK